VDEELKILAAAEARRLRDCLDGLNPLLEQLIDAASVAHARRVLAERAWSDGGCKPDDPWLKVARDSLRDCLAAMRLLLKHANSASVDPLRL
jgi:hypothetical protein